MTTMLSGERRPVLMIAVGRQRVGKTVFLNTAIQFFRAHGANVEIWNADMLNTSHNLTVFFDDVQEPGEAGPEDVKIWLEERFLSMVENRCDAVLDVGGGDTPLARLVDELPIVSGLEDEGIRVVLVHVLGPEIADLDYLANFLEGNLFAPEATLLVLNNGLILSGRSPDSAFGAIVKHWAFSDAVRKNAKWINFPRLPCMAAVTDRELTFDEAMRRVAKNDKGPVSLFDAGRVKRWWREDVVKCFSQIPLEWMPEMPDFAEREMIG